MSDGEFSERNARHPSNCPPDSYRLSMVLILVSVLGQENTLTHKLVQKTLISIRRAKFRPATATRNVASNPAPPVIYLSRDPELGNTRQEYRGSSRIC